MQRPCVGRNEGEAFAIDGEWGTLSRMSPNHLARASVLRHHAEPFHLRPATILTANRGSCGTDDRHTAAHAPFLQFFTGYVPLDSGTLPNGISTATNPQVALHHTMPILRLPNLSGTQPAKICRNRADN